MTAARSDLPLPLSPFSAQFGFHISYFSRPDAPIQIEQFSILPLSQGSFCIPIDYN